MSLRKLLFSFLFLIFFLKPKPVLADQPLQTVDKVTNFHSEITINQNTSIFIKETIDYETSLQKHGIYRYIPVRYKQGGFSYTTKIKDVKITDELNEPIPHTSFKESGNQVFKIGDPDKTFTGKKTYVLSYTTEDALKRFENHDELFWDITGEGWKIPIGKSTAKIISSYAIITKIECYSGMVGTNDDLCEKSFSQNEAIFSYPSTISYGDNFTVVVALDQNSSIIFPSKLELFIKWLKDNFFLFLIPLPFLIIFALWFKKGRDHVFTSPNVFNLDERRPKNLKPLFYKHRTPFVYEPLKDLTPGEAGAVFDEKVDNQDVIAEILDLARKRYLKIEAIGKKGLFKKQDFKFIKLKNPDDKLPEHQHYLLTAIFGSKREKTLSKLKGKFYKKMEDVKELIQRSATKKKLFTRNPKKDRILYIAIFVLLSVLGFFPMIFAVTYTNSALPLLVYIVCEVAGFILAFNMPQKTAVGTNLMLQARGLKQVINRGKWREEIKEKNLFIEEIFPFAVALGVVKKLARDMEQLNIQPPSYFPAYAAGYHGSLSSFTDSFSSQVSSGLSYNPSSSSRSGGSGFSGGSSGGGGGGGGGGSW